MKLVVNAILGVEMQAIAEAAALGQRAGLNRGVLLDVLSQTAVIAQAHFGKLGRAAINDYSPRFPLRLMNKDFRLILDMARMEMRICLRLKQRFKSAILRCTAKQMKIFPQSCATGS